MFFIRAILALFFIIFYVIIISFSYIGYKNSFLSSGEVAIAIKAVPTIATRIWYLAEAYIKMIDHLGRIEDSMKLIVHPQKDSDKGVTEQLEVSEGAISLENIKFNYGLEKSVINNLKLQIPAGQKVGLVGKSGAGKSTLIRLLLRFYDLEGGSIEIDGQDISKVTRESLRRNISVVTQEPSLFHRSILENIRYGKPDASLEEVIIASKKAHAHEFIQDLEDKDGRKAYDALVGERGVKLSGGQRQRVAIARVILANAPILILDEATSALDSEVESSIQEEIKEVMKGKTVIAIAHRLSTIKQLDRLIILDEGSIVEDGSHDDLVKKKDGKYAKLWNMQSGGFLST
jgi:ABC-type multidrug transport system fused ATPase/permease subunit